MTYKVSIAQKQPTILKMQSYFKIQTFMSNW